MSNVTYVINTIVCGFLCIVLLVVPQVFTEQAGFYLSIIRSLGFSYLAFGVLSLIAILIAKNKTSNDFLALISLTVFHATQAVSHYIDYLFKISPLFFLILAIVHTALAIMFIIDMAMHLGSLILSIRKIDPLSSIKKTENNTSQE